MATKDQVLSSRRAANAGTAYAHVSQRVTFTVAGNTTVKKQITLPAGSALRGVQVETPADVGGTPSSCNFRCGTTDTGQQVVADVDAKGQGHIASTIVTGYDKVGGIAADTILYLQLTTAGGTSSTGTVYGIVDYAAPVF